MKNQSTMIESNVHAVDCQTMPLTIIKIGAYIDMFDWFISTPNQCFKFKVEIALFDV